MSIVWVLLRHNNTKDYPEYWTVALVIVVWSIIEFTIHICIHKRAEDTWWSQHEQLLIEVSDVKERGVITSSVLPKANSDSSIPHSTYFLKLPLLFSFFLDFYELQRAHHWTYRPMGNSLWFPFERLAGNSRNSPKFWFENEIPLGFIRDFPCSESADIPKVFDRLASF